MNLRALLLALALLATAPLWAADEPDEADPKGGSAEVAKFQGTWQPVSMLRDGTRLEPTEFDAMRLIVDEGQYTFKTQKGERRTGTFKLRPAQKPAVLETTYAEPPDEGKTVSRIYVWVDDVTLKICSPGPDERVPDNFEAPRGSGRDLTVWKRVDK